LKETKSCVIIGAGIAALMAANVLKANGLNTVVLDKGRGVGGRIATRRIEGSVFDHGAQYFTAKDKTFLSYVDKWLEKGIIRTWDYKSDEKNKRTKYIGKNGMTALPKYLAQNLIVKLDRQVVEINFSQNMWQTKTFNDEIFSADAMIITAPLPQSIALLQSGNLSSNNGFYSKLDRIVYDPCIALMILIEGEASLLPSGVLKLSGEPLSWIADNLKKGISRGRSALTIHAGPEYSRKYWDMDDRTLANNMLYITSDWIKEAYHSYQLKKWKFSSPRSIYHEKYFFLSLPKPLTIAGDAFGGPRVEGAALSGLAAAEAILNALQ
jgi:predicted NAD/FAD-dependent oxidoreductase